MLSWRVLSQLINKIQETERWEQSASQVSDRTDLRTWLWVSSQQGLQGNQGSRPSLGGGGEEALGGQADPAGRARAPGKAWVSGAAERTGGCASLPGAEEGEVHASMLPLPEVPALSCPFLGREARPSLAILPWKCPMELTCHRIKSYCAPSNMLIFLQLPWGTTLLIKRRPKAVATVI